MISPRVVLSIALASAAASLAAPASALAVDRFVDRDTGTDFGDCTLVAPCDSISFAISVAAGGDTVRVDDSSGEYGDSAEINGLSLIGTEFVGGDEGDVVIDSNSSFPAVRVTTSAGTINGLTLRSDATAAQLLGDVDEVSGNVFDSPGEVVDIDVNAGDPLITGNTFADSNTTIRDTGITVDTASPTITGNEFSNHAKAIEVGVSGAAPLVTIEGNEITGTHAATFTNGAGIQAQNSSNLVVEDNVMTSGPGSSQLGVSVFPGGTNFTPTVEMRRNQVYDFSTGVFISDTTAATMNGDVIGGSTDDGLVAFNDTAVGTGSVIANNVTVVGDPTAGDRDIFVSEAVLTLDSSIVGDDGITSNTGTCNITRSRGPVTTPGGDGCADFTTSAAVNFVDPATNDFHLTANNPDLIDDGDPAAPSSPNALDYDQQKRNVDGDGNCSQVRDVGADEFMPAAPTANITDGPEDGSTITVGSAEFSFTNSNTCAGASFECSLDGAAFTACTSPATLSSLGDGAHTFAVRALDLVPQPGAPDSRSFTVDLPDPPAADPPATPPVAKKKCKKGQKLKKGKCVKKKRKKR